MSAAAARRGRRTALTLRQADQQNWHLNIQTFNHTGIKKHANIQCSQRERQKIIGLHMQTHTAAQTERQKTHEHTCRGTKTVFKRIESGTKLQKQTNGRTFK